MRHITKEDLNLLAHGCALLGSGGGGNPAYDLLIAEHALEKYGDVALISVDELSDDALVVPMAFMGAPLIATEKLPSGREFPAIMEILKKHGKKLVLMPAEIGGANGLCAFAVAAKMGIPVLDADTLGRAFPQLQMSSCNLHGVPASPAYFADSLGNTVKIHAEDSLSLERIGRHVSISMGSSCAIAIYLMEGKRAKTAVIPGSVTLALSLGQAALDARKKGMNPLEKLMEITEGVLLIAGIITEVVQEVKDGFLQGSVTIKSDEREVEVIYQNEFLLAKEEKKPIATTPDILAIVESEGAIPLTTDGLRFGLKVALIAIPSPAIWQTDAGLALVGPEFFGYRATYKPIKKEEILI